MKKSLLMLASSLVIVSSGAFAQGNSDACHNQYGACMERCVSRPQSLQESCASSCEATTNQCYTGIYGGRAQVPAMSAAPSQNAEPADGEPEPDARDARGEAKPAPTTAPAPKKR